jgi:hypothetical protein
MVEFQNGEIDPVKYGVLWERVQHMDRKITKMEGQLDELIALANKGRGGLWFGMTVASAVSGFIGFLFSHWKGN